jgi:hypothetical protein
MNKRQWIEISQSRKKSLAYLCITIVLPSTPTLTNPFTQIHILLLIGRGTGFPEWACESTDSNQIGLDHRVGLH